MTTATETTTTETQTSGSDTTTQTTTAQDTTTQGSTSAQTGGDTTTTTTTTDAPWQDSLPDGLKTDPLFRLYKTQDEAMKAHAALYKARGVPAERLLTVPDKPADQSPDDWAPIHKALGVPDDPKDYKIDLAPEAADDAAGLSDILRELGGKAKLQPAQMDAIIGTLNELGKKSVEAEQAQLKADGEAVTADLKKEWGAAYDGNRRAIGKLLRDGAGGQLDDASLAALETQLGNNKLLLNVLAYAVGKMAEPEAPEGTTVTKGALTPAGATAALADFNANPDKVAALRDKNHPQHGAVLQERSALLAQQRGAAA